MYLRNLLHQIPSFLLHPGGGIGEGSVPSKTISDYQEPAYINNLPPELLGVPEERESAPPKEVNRATYFFYNNNRNGKGQLVRHNPADHKNKGNDKGKSGNQNGSIPSNLTLEVTDDFESGLQDLFYITLSIFFSFSSI